MALILLTLTVALGVANVRRARTEHVPRFVFDAVHRTAALLAVAFVVVHVATSLLDSYAPIRAVDAIVPFVSAYRPAWLGLGAVAFDLLIAVTLTSLVRRRFGHRAWRAVHWLTYASWPVALVHGFGTGTDAKATWMLFLTGACVVVVIVAVVARATAGWPDHLGARVGALAASAMVPIGLLVWLPSGPLAAGWAKRAGTPASLLASSTTGAGGIGGAGAAGGTGAAGGAGAADGAGAAGGTGARSSGAPSFTAAASGTVNEGPSGGGLNVVEISLGLTGQRLSELRFRLVGQPVGEGGVQMTSSHVTLGPPSNPELYTGAITALEGGNIQALLASAGGQRLVVVAQLQISPGGGSVTGSVNVSPSASAGAGSAAGAGEGE